MEKEKYYIWSNEHNCWWRSNHAGYTTFIESAGLYSKNEALEICNGANYSWDMDRNILPDELPIAESIAKNLKSGKDE
jgi:hypothetical protein|tara:strand:+ start:4263 stop:4496 length:234 start_codon:yes stop_codon:yes gene_type:complete